MNWILPLGLGYLLGSTPFGLLLTRITGAGDLRAIGSGNIGATNVLRTGRKGLAAATLLLDAGKGVAAVLLAARFFDSPAFAPGDVAALAGLGAFIGHCFPVWLRFRGGKGVATMLGVSFAFHLLVGLVAAVVWLGMARLSKISSVGGMSAAIAAPLAGWALGLGLHNMVPALALMAALLVWNHRENIARLVAGTEPRIGARKA